MREHHRHEGEKGGTRRGTPFIHPPIIADRRATVVGVWTWTVGGGARGGVFICVGLCLSSSCLSSSSFFYCRHLFAQSLLSAPPPPDIITTSTTTTTTTTRQQPWRPAR